MLGTRKITLLHKTLVKVNENRKSMKISTRHTESVKKRVISKPAK